MLKKKFTLIAGILCVILLGFAADRRLHKKDVHFALDNIIVDHPYSASWDIGPPTPIEEKKLQKIFSQKFTYFSKGSQSYVFISDDQKYILKLFKRYVYQPKSFLAYLPFPSNSYYKEHQAKLQKKISAFNACATAYREIKDRCGLVYLHLNPSPLPLHKLQVIDKRGKEYLLDLGKTSFQLQRKAELIYPRIDALMQQGEKERAEAIISSVFNILDEFGKRGICENDPILRKNFGLIDDEAIQIDVGKMKINEERKHNLVYKQEIEGISLRFKQWLTQNYPELLPHFEKKLQETTGP